ncbi:MAG: hypothetical protein F6K24_11280 [Okeania sp. SIO2D1]|uniref:hypothetical protein n=1 Tax=Okeania sp. SIO2C9 TaxID=2607791 RepID=UPI0013BE1C9B|nr:hypothetical protein [Okeania sp. SIO2C9]NEQ76466.1 hypothetical protein [Okeania sp. SIO2C9]NES65798.1 hypothetical protein [Okeania sp. SIO2D1]
MIGHSLEIDDLKKINSPKKIVALFNKLSYNLQLENLEIEQLELPTSCSGYIDNVYKIHSDEEDNLEIFLLELLQAEFQTNRKLQEKIITISQNLPKSKKKNYSFVQKTIIS